MIPKSASFHASATKNKALHIQPFFCMGKHTVGRLNSAMNKVIFMQKLEAGNNLLHEIPFENRAILKTNKLPRKWGWSNHWRWHHWFIYRTPSDILGKTIIEQFLTIWQHMKLALSDQPWSMTLTKLNATSLEERLRISRAAISISLSVTLSNFLAKTFYLVIVTKGRVAVPDHSFGSTSVQSQKNWREGDRYLTYFTTTSECDMPLIQNMRIVRHDFRNELNWWVV